MPMEWWSGVVEWRMCSLALDLRHLHEAGLGKGGRILIMGKFRGI